MSYTKFTKIFNTNSESETSITIQTQDVSNDKYLKLYKIKSNLVDYNKETLESHINFTHEKDDLFFGLNASIFETLKESYEDKYEYILPEITIDKNLLNHDQFGNLDLQTNISTKLYDTNKLKNFIGKYGVEPFAQRFNFKYAKINPKKISICTGFKL